MESENKNPGRPNLRMERFNRKLCVVPVIAGITTFIALSGAIPPAWGGSNHYPGRGVSSLDSGDAMNWLVKSVCVDSNNLVLPIDPYGDSPPGTTIRKMKVGDPLPYHNVYQNGKDEEYNEVLWGDDVQGTVKSYNGIHDTTRRYMGILYSEAALNSPFYSSRFVYKVTRIPINRAAVKIRFSFTPLTHQVFDVLDAWFAPYPILTTGFGAARE